MNTKLYWKLRTLLLKIVFSIRKVVFGIGSHYDDEKKNSSFFKQIIKTVIIKSITTGILILPLYFLDSYLIERFKATPLDANILTGIVVGGMGLAGVVLGLYCSNISSIFSSSYVNVSNQLANAYQRDIINKKCIGNTIGYIVFCVIVLGECIAKTNVFYTTIATFLFLTLKVIVTFGVAGNRAYHLSSTYKLSENAYIDIRNALNNVAKNGFIIQDINFQNHCRAICSNRIALLNEISVYNKDNPETQNSALTSFISGNNVLLTVYWKHKYKISFDSFWYPELPEYQQWHEASYTETSIHNQTATHLDVKKVKDYLWFEKSINKINELNVKKLIKNKDFESLYLYLNSIEFTKEVVYGDVLDYVYAFISELRLNILELACEDEKNSDISTIIDVLTALYLSLINCVCLYLKELNIDNVLEEIVNLDSYSKADRKKSYFSYLNNNVVKELFEKIAIEKNNEGKRITPDWYIKQTISAIMYVHINKLCKHLQNLSSDVLDTGELLLGKKKFYEASLAFSRALQIDAKFTAFSIENYILEALSKLKLKGKANASQWEKSAVDDFKNKRKAICRTLPNKALRSSQIFALEHLDDRKKHPDLLGYSYNRIYEYLISSIETNDFETFEALYKNLLANVFLYREYIRNHVAGSSNYNDTWKLNVVTSPIVDYAVVSSLAIIWGEFVVDERWRNIVFAETNEYINKSESADVTQKDVLIQLFTGAAKWKNSFFSHCRRDITTTDWELRIARAIRSHDSFEIEYQKFGQKVVKTSSKLFREYCGYRICDMGLNKSEELFWVLCINPWCKPEDKYHTRSKWEENLDEE